MVALIAVSGYSSGLFIEFAAFGDDSKVQRLIDNGTFDEKWIPFIRSAQMYVPSYLESVSIDSGSWSFLKNAYLLEALTGDIDSAYLDFTIDTTRVSPTVGHDFFRNEITECIFTTDDTLNFETCVICQLTDINGIVVADGRTDVPNISPTADPIVVKIDNFWVEDARDVRNIHDVIIAVCDGEDGGEGCTPGFWKQPQHFGFWVGFDPSDKYETVFGPGVDITVQNNPNPPILDPTLLEALSAQGGSQNALARHSVAALLNAASGIVSFDFSTAAVIAIVQDAFSGTPTRTFEEAKNLLAAANESLCLIGGQNPVDSNLNAFSETGGVDSTTYDGSTATPYEKKQYALEQLNILVTDPGISQNTID